MLGIWKDSLSLDFMITNTSQQGLTGILKEQISFSSCSIWLHIVSVSNDVITKLFGSELTAYMRCLSMSANQF